MAAPTYLWSRIAAAPRRFSFWLKGASGALASLLLFGDQLASFSQGKAMLWCFEIFDRFRGELMAICALIFCGGWIGTRLAGAFKVIADLLRRGRPIKGQVRMLLVASALIGGLAILGVRAGKFYNNNRRSAWRHYSSTLVLRGQQALADHQDRKAKFLLRVAAEVEGSEAARRILNDIEERERWSAEFWAFYDRVPEGALARLELLREEAPLELNQDRLEYEAERIRLRFRQERKHFVEAIYLLEQGKVSRAKGELKQACEALRWLGNCRVLLRDLETGGTTIFLPALKRYGAERFSSEMLAQDDARMRNLF